MTYPLGFILEDDSISLASKAYIHFCSGKGVGLWLVVEPQFVLHYKFYFRFSVTFSSWFNLAFGI
jgi:hypothetical protein